MRLTSKLLFLIFLLPYYLSTRIHLFFFFLFLFKAMTKIHFNQIYTLLFKSLGLNKMHHVVAAPGKPGLTLNPETALKLGMSRACLGGCCKWAAVEMFSNCVQLAQLL